MQGKNVSSLGMSSTTSSPISPKKQFEDESLCLSQYKEVINDTLLNYRSENFPDGILSLASDIVIKQSNDNVVIFYLTMPFPCQGELDEISISLSAQLHIEISCFVSLEIQPVRSFSLKGSDSKVSNIIAIASGKGGVGKSTTTVNLAYALMAEGAKVGILDADIYGPSIPTMIGLKNDKPSSVDGKFMKPMQAHGLSAMSIGFLVDEKDATVWRGPMASSAFNQLLNETAWPELDYLLIDMPPGTGDIQLTLAQKVPVAAAVIVTTPQDIALVDAIKGVNMFKKVKVPVVGLIENMSYHLCQQCGHKSHLFGEKGGGDMSKSQNIPLLGQLPLEIGIRESADNGLSGVIETPEGDTANLYRKLARNMASKLFYQLDTRSPLTPDIINVRNV